MLLQRLVSYEEDTPFPDEDTNLRPYSRARTVRWRLDVDTGELIDLADPSSRLTRNGRSLLVPHLSRTSGVAPCLGADDIQYVLGWVDENSKPDRVAACHEAFITLCRQWASATR